MTSIIRRSPLRSKLALTTALAGGVVGFGGIAQAQNTPTTPTVVAGAGVTFNGGGAGNANGAPTNLGVNLGGNPNTIINWADFDVSAGSTVDFNSSLGAVPAAVLNRVTGGTTSEILGSITSDANVAVWLLNPNGILINGAAPGSGISTGSFVASTLGVTDADFLAGNTYSLSGPAASTAGIIVNGATITTADGNRGLILVAPQIDADGTFNAGNREVAFITASDVTLSFTPGSPLGVTLNEGTAVAGNSQVIRGNVSGRSVYFALASQAAVTDALLDVDATVVATTAALSTTGIVLAAGTASGPVSLGGGNVAGIADITVNGSLTATGPEGAIAFRANGDIAGTASASASQGFVAAGQAVGLGAIIAGDLVEIDANGVFTATSLSGEDGVDIDQAGAFTSTVSGAVVASSGGFTADGGTAMEFGSINVDGNINIGGSAVPTSLTVNGDTDAGGTLRVRTTNAQIYAGTASAAGSVNLANTVAGNITLTGGLNSNGSTVDVDAVGSLIANSAITGSNAVTLEGATISLSNVTSINDSIELTTISGALSVNDLFAGNDITVASAGNASLNGDLGAGDDLVVTGTSVALGDAAVDEMLANGTIVIESTAGAVSGSAGLLRSALGGGGGNFLIIDAATSIALGGTALNSGVADVGLNAGAGSTIATGGISAALLGDANGTNTGVLTTFNHNAGTTFGDLTITDSNLDIELTAGGLTTGDVDVGNGGILMTVAGALVAGDVVGDDSVVMLGASLTAGDITSTTDNVIARSLAGNLSVDSLSAVTDSVEVTSVGGSVSVAGNVTAGTNYLIDSAGDVNLGDDPDAEIQRASGFVQIGAQGALTGGSGLTLRSGTGDITLFTDGAVGGNIAFAADSLIQAGATGVERDVLVISRTAGNSVVLGDVSARGLLGGITGGPVPSNGITRDASISVDQANLVNALALTSNLGNVSVGGVSVTGAGQGITLQAPTGTLTAPGSLSASGNIVLNGFNALAFGALTSTTGSVSATSTGGTLTTGVVSGQTGVTLAANGNLLAVGANAAGGSVTLTSSAGNATLGSAAASGNVGVNAALTATIADNVTAGGNYTVNAGSVSLGDDPGAELQQAADNIDIRAASGSISGGAGLTLRSDSNGAVGGDLFLDATTNIALGGAAVQAGTAGTGRVGIRVGAGQSIALGDTIGQTVGLTDAPHLALNPIVHDASVSFGDVTTVGTPFSIALTSGNIVTGNVNATDIALTANAGSVTANGLTSAANVIVSASGAASIAGNVTAGGAYTVTGQSVELGVDGDAEVQRAAGAVTITANGGALAGGDGLILRSDSNNAGGETLTLTLGAGSNLAFGQAAIEGGTNRSSLIRVNYVDAAPSLVFGDVSGTGFQSFNGSTTFTNSLSGGSGNIVTGDLDFSTNLFISTGGTLTTGGINGSQSVSLSSLGALTVNGPVTTAAGFSGSSNASITLSDSVTAAGAVGLSSAGAITGTTVSAGTSLTVSSNSGDVALGTVTSGGAMTLQTLGGGGDVRVDSATGAALTIISAGDVRGNSGARATLNSTAGSVAVTAAGAAMLDTVTASQNISISAASIDVNGLNAVNGSLTLNSTGAGLTLGNVTGQTGVSLTALGDLSVASATSGAGDVSLASTAGSTTLGSATAAGNVGVTAALAATVSGNVNAGGNYSVTGGSVNLGVDGNPELQQAVGAVTITANNGPLTGGTGLVLRSNSDDVGAELLTLSLGAGAGLAFGATEIEGGANRTSRVRIEAIDAAPALVFGDVSGLTFQSNITGSFDSPNALFTGGSVTTGDLDFSAELGVFGTGVTTGSVNSGSFSELNAGSGALVVNGPVTIAGQFVANGGSINFADSVTGGSQIQMNSAGAISGTTVNAATGIGISGGSVDFTGLDTAAGALNAIATAGNLSVGTVDGGGAVTLQTTGGAGDVRVDSATAAGLLTINSVDQVRGDGTARANLTSTGGAVAVAAGGAVDLGTGVAATSFGVTGSAIDATALTASGGALTLTAGAGGIILGSGAGQTATLSTTGTATIATGLNTSGNISISAVSAALAPIVSTAGSVSITTIGGDYTGFAGDRADITAGTDVTLAVAGDALIGTLDAGGAISVTAASLDAATIDAVGAVSTTTSGATFANAVQGASITATGSSIAIGTVISGGLLDLSATAGDLTLATGTAAGLADIDATGAVQIGTLDAGSALIDAGTTLNATLLDVAGALTTTSLGATMIATIDAGVADITGGSIWVGDVTAAGTIDMDATAGDLTIGTGTAGGQITLTASNDIMFTTLDTGAGASLTAGGDIIGDMLSAVGAVSTTAGGVTDIGALDANGIAITSAVIDIASISTPGSLALTSTVGDLTLGSGSAGTTLTLNSAANLDVATSLTAGGLASATAVGDATIAAITSSGSDVVVTARSIDIGTASANGLLDVSATGGGLTLGAGTAGGNAALDASGAISLDDLTGGGTVTLVAGGALDAANVGATGAATAQSGGATVIGTLAGSSVVATGTSVAIGTVTAGTTLAVTASAGDAAVNGTAGTTATVAAGRDVLIGTGLTAGGATTITAGRDARLAQVTATGGALTVTATGGQVSGATAGARADLIAGGAGNALTVTAGDTVLIGTANGAGGVTVNADAIDANSLAAASGGAIALTATAGGITLGTGNASGNAGLTATGAVGVGSLSAANIAINGAGVTTTTLSSTGSTAITATGAATLGATTAGSSLAVTANGINAGATSAGTTLSLTSGGGIALASATAGGNATLDAANSASLGALTAGATATLRVRATEVTINGAQRAGTIELVNRTPATAMRLGDDTAAGGFSLSNAEIGLLEANTLTLDNGTGAVEIGTLAFDADAGRTAVNVLTTGQMDILGTISGSGAGRLFRFGGDASATGMADQIRIVSTADAGGRLLFDTSDVELRGERIVMGLAVQFVDTILGGTPLSVDAVAGLFISNPNSALYNTLFSGQVYVDKTTLVANSLTVRFGEYALFQNTEGAGLSGGAVLGGPAGAPVMPALTVDGSNSASGDGFALFGTINGVTGTAAALLGPSVIVVNMVDIPNARVNGCLIGSGAGCLTSVVTQPTLNVFDSSRLDVLRAADDLSLPFDPVVGTNNEALFSGVSSVDTQVTGDECEENPEAPECKASEEETVQ